MSEELRDPFPELHQRAGLAWGRVRRHPDYKREAADCLNSLRHDIRQQFAGFLEEYPPDDAERWTLAKADAPLPVHRSRRVLRRFRPWQRTLLKFYNRWGICFPIPPAVDAPHPTVLAWLAPRPAEVWGDPFSDPITMRVTLRAPLNRILACLKEEVGRVRRYHRIQRGTEKTLRVVRLDGTRECLLRVPLLLRLDAMLAQAKTLILGERRAHQIGAGDKRERPDQEWRALRVWDLFFREGKSLRVVARTLDCSPHQAWRAVKRAHWLIHKEPYPGKRRAIQRVVDFASHLETCVRCRTNERLCPKGNLLLNLSIGAPTGLSTPARPR